MPRLSALAFASAIVLASIGTEWTLAQSQGDGSSLAIAFADPAWTGEKIPDRQWCRKFGGHGDTPALKVSNLPAGTKAVVVAFNDETYKPMDNGGHGAVRFQVPEGSTSATLPSVPGETDDLPQGVSTEKPHQATDFSGTKGAYLPPCSGGKGNTYSATVKALGEGDKVLAQGRIVLGKY